jgi:hypothetical protein
MASSLCQSIFARQPHRLQNRKPMSLYRISSDEIEPAPRTTMGEKRLSTSSKECIDRGIALLKERRSPLISAASPKR